MKSVCLWVLLLLSASAAFSQAPHLDQGYFQFGLSAGYATGSVKSGYSFGGMHFGGVANGIFAETSALSLSSFNEGSETSKFLFLDLLSADIGVGMAFHDLYVGISPLSINLTQAPGFGISLLTKYRLKNVILEAKLIPVKYTKNEIPMLKNNSYFGAQYWFTDIFSLGFRLTTFDKYKNANLTASWDIMQ